MLHLARTAVARPCRQIVTHPSLATRRIQGTVTSTFHTSAALQKHQGKKTAKAKGKQNDEAAPAEEIEDGEPKRKGKKGMTTADLLPASASKLLPEARLEFDKAEKKMSSCLDWFKKELSVLENRAVGRVTPAILDGVKVEAHHSDGALVKLQEVATVGVKEGTILMVTVFDEHNLKHVEKAIYAAKIPNCTPQKIDSRTLRIPMPRPTLESIAAFVKTSSTLTEETKVKIRSAREGAVKVVSKLGCDKKSPEMAEIQKITEKWSAEAEVAFQKFKKDVGHSTK
ncbi:hypothetical protein FRC03_006886 [Tulasnella sp. 419]|nr:hypothetical protein FRC03_006886 [Tulasnella sp. 419]